ncbi:MAG: hypothetical protein ACRCSK_05710 [Fusobacteriaceae bacterium]
MKRIFLILFFSFITLTSLASTEKSIEGDYDFFAPLPIAEFPYNKSGNFNPSMGTSIALTDSIIQGSNYMIWTSDLSPIAKYATLAATDFVYFFALQNMFMHEVGHYAVARNASVDVAITRTGNVPTNSTQFEVLKENSLAEFVHFDVAGFELETQLQRNMSARRFNFNTKANDIISMWFTAFSPFGYYLTGMNEVNKLDGKNNAIWTDPAIWTFNIFNPSASVLTTKTDADGKIKVVKSYNTWVPTEEEKSYLATSTALSALNFLDPQLFGFNRFETENFYYNAATRFFGTAFGRQVVLDTYFIPVSSKHRYQISLMLNSNKEKTGFGISFLQTALKVPYGNITYELAAWQQPEDLKFYATKMIPGGMISLNYDIDISKNVSLLLGGGYKSNGWVPGLVYLNEGVFGKAGATIKF